MQVVYLCTIFRAKMGGYAKIHVKNIARRYRFIEIPLTGNRELSFKHRNMRGSRGNEGYSGPVRIDVYYTTGTVVVTLRDNANGRHSKQILKNVDSQKLQEIFRDSDRQFLNEN